MAYCKANQLDCNGFCNRFDAPCIKNNCRFFGVKTNADCVRAMDDEELATDLLDMFEEICEDGVPSKEWMMHWLKQPAEV